MAPLHIPRALLNSEQLNGGLRSARRAVIAAGPDLARLSAHHLSRRALTVNSTQKVTLGVIAGYTVAIALLWNLPYIRWSLWPFKVSGRHLKQKKRVLTWYRCLSLLSMNLDMP